MTPGGTLAAEVVTRDGVVSEARIVSTRRVPLAAALRGKSVREAVALVPLLFATCGIAHGVAASAAVESASGAGDLVREGGPRARARTRARALLVASEVVDGHVWSILVDWARVLGGSPAAAELRAHRAATERLRAAIDPARASLGLGAWNVHASRGGLASALADVDSLVSQLASDLPDDVSGLAAWAHRSRSPAAPLVKHLLDAPAASIGASDVAPLPELSAAWFRAQLSADAMFGERPTLDGAPREAGPLARAAVAPLVASVVAQHGRGALARIAARLVELAAAPGRLRALARDADAGDADAGDADAGDADAGEAGAAAELSSTGGCGVADTARGRLAHWALVEKGVVVDWRFVAPTEWTFHPGGAFSRGLIGARSADVARTIRLHVAALDPCIPCDVTVRDAADARPAHP